MEARLHLRRDQAERNGASETVVVAVLSGALPQGSRGNRTISRWVERIKEVIDKSSPVRGVVLDCSELTYTGGDSFASLWITPLSWGLREAVLVATGSTRRALEGLMRVSLAVPIVGNRQDAMDFLSLVDSADRGTATGSGDGRR